MKQGNGNPERKAEDYIQMAGSKAYQFELELP